VLAQVVLGRLRYRLTLRDLAEMVLHRGIVCSHAASASGRRSWRRSRFVDATYLKVRGRWYYLYRAIDRHGALIDPC
jgi:putative transposase